MIELFGIKYMTQKEAAARYGYSQAWFQRQRHLKLPPCYVKMNRGRIYYSVDLTDKWFEKNMRKSDE